MMKGMKSHRKSMKASAMEGSTVIMRQAQPKYNFPMSSKSKKETTGRKSAPCTSHYEAEGMDLSMMSNRSHPSTSTAAVYSSSSSASTPPIFAKDLRCSSDMYTDQQNTNNQQAHRAVKPINVVDPLMTTGVDLTTGGNNSTSNNNINNSGPVDPVSSNPVINTISTHLDFINGPKCWRDSCDNEKKTLQNEVDSLKSQLDVQFQVNSELKKLLVASVGEDLQYRVEKLMRDKVQLSMEVGGYSKKVSEDYENLDKLSIQADIWRSKFMASRVLIDELAKGRAILSSQYQESQDAIQRLLNERHELQSHLTESCRSLKQVNDAFDPLNTQNLVALPNSSNVIDLVKVMQQLSEAIRFRLLPGGTAATGHNMAIQSAAHYPPQSKLTPAEAHAQDVLLKKVAPLEKTTVLRMQSIKLLPPDSLWMDRYHHTIQYENLTLNCCSKCKGDIQVV